MQHNFEDSLKLSALYAEAPWWLIVYKKAFPNLASSVSVRDDGWAQRGGIDRVITLDSGKTLTIDEKVRNSDWPDIILEYWSDEKRKVRGWIAKDLACDYIAYAFVPSKKCYLLPFLQLRAAWQTNRNKWVRKYKRIEAKNNGYVTVSVPVPTDELLNAIKDSLVISW